MSDTVKYKLVDKEGFLGFSTNNEKILKRHDGVFEGNVDLEGDFVLDKGGYIYQYELENFFELVTDDQKDQGYVYEGKEHLVVHGETELIELKSFIKKYVSKRMGKEWNPLERGGDGDILVYAGSNPTKNYNVRWGFDYDYRLQGNELTVQQFLDKYDPERQVKEESKTEQKGNPKYDVTIVGKYNTGSCVVDVYSVLEAFGVTIPQLQHSVKKELKVGNRGHKDIRQDLVDIRDSTQSALDAYDAKIKLK